MKSGFQTSEGIQVSALIGFAIPILGYLAGIDFTEDDTKRLMDTTLTAASTVKDIAAYWQSTQKSVPAELGDLGKFGGLLFFVYKVYNLYLTKRIDLKKHVAELEAKHV